jgi:predicted amidohydrolase
MNENSEGLVRIAGVQMNPAVGDTSRNLEYMIERLREAAESGAKLVVFPECALTGYIFASRDEAALHAQAVPGPATERFAGECRKLGVAAVCGMIERNGDRLHNAAVLVRPDGTHALYRKVHLPFVGVDRFLDPGDLPLEVHEAAGLRLGIHICYDGAFPETGRVQTLKGADLLVLITNWPRGAETQAEHLMPCRALENVVWGIVVDRVGEERGARFIGQSAIVDPQGRWVARAGVDTEEVISATIDAARARDKKIVRKPGEHELDRIKDRRPELYGLISEETK